MDSPDSAITPPPDASWQVLDSREIYSAKPWVTLSLQQVRLPDGRLVNDYHRVEMPEYAVVFAETTDGCVVLERQYKQGIGRVTLTLPGGLVEAGENPLDAAQRELLEETGYQAAHWQHLGSFVPNSNYGCGKAHLFRARDARRVAEANPGDLETIELVLMTRDQLLDQMAGGDVDSMSMVAAVALATHPRFEKLYSPRSRAPA